jgi:uncharacterized repeat protein (TIGR02543 family)
LKIGGQFVKKNFSLGISLLLVFLISCAGGTSSQTSLQSISLNTFTVVFESRGGSNIPNQTVEPNSFISPPNVLREGYTFEGWYTSLNNGDTFESKWNFFSDRVNFDFTLYASWTINQYTISFSYKTLQLQEIQHVSAGSRHSLAVTTSGRVYAWGYNFYGQLGDGTTTNRPIPTIIIDYPFVTITTLVNNYLTVTYNEAINLLDPTLEGYVFEGWFMNESLTIPYNLTTMPGNDVMLYAKFTPVVD